MSTPFHKWIPLAGAVFAIGAYFASYLYLSSHGRFEPACIGTNGVKWYEWAPRGFVREFRRNQMLTAGYFPLYYLDIRYWHTSDVADTGRYPINLVRREDTWKLVEAWKKWSRTIASSEQEAASTPDSVLESDSRCLLSLTQAFGFYTRVDPLGTPFRGIIPVQFL